MFIVSISIDASWHQKKKIARESSANFEHSKPIFLFFFELTIQKSTVFWRIFSNTFSLLCILQIHCVGEPDGKLQATFNGHNRDLSERYTVVCRVNCRKRMYVAVRELHMWLCVRFLCVMLLLHVHMVWSRKSTISLSHKHTNMHTRTHKHTNKQTHTFCRW